MKISCVMKLLSKNYTNGLMDGILTYKFLIGADNLSVSDNVNIQQVNYRTENEFTHFKFSDVHVSDIMMSFGTFKICLDNVVIKSDNSCNRDIRDMRTNGLILKLEDANIISFVREGFKTYDADGNLMSNTPDEEIEESEYIETFNNFLDGYAFLIEKENENYTFVFDGTDERSYTVIIAASKDICEWDRFMNIEG